MSSAATNETTELIITSSAFENNGNIPSKYTCDGEKINPPLLIDKIPADTKSLVLIAEDPDTAKGIFDHWLAWNIEPTPFIKENTNPGISGTNGAGKTGYHPPCPPDGTHRYYFYIYALNNRIYLAPGANKQELKEAIEHHIIAKGTLMGRYRKI